MAIFDINGNSLSKIYDKDATEINSAYDINGNPLKSLIILKVMTYNVGSWYDGNHDNVPADKDSSYYALQNGMIQQNDPDILCIEEYTKQFSKLPRTAISLLEQYFPYIHEQGGDSSTDTSGRCICSKYPITDYTTHQYSQSGSPRYYDTCTITINEVPITVVVTHLNYNADSDTARIAQLNELITYLQTLERFVSCGDYNMLHCKSTSDEDYLSMMIPLLNAGFHCANCTDFGFLETYSDQPIKTYTGCLDNIVTSANIGITDAYVDETKLTDGLADKTDHMPLVADIVVS